MRAGYYHELSGFSIHLTRCPNILPVFAITLGMDAINVDDIQEINFSGENNENAEVTYKDGSTETYHGDAHPEIFEMLNHWTPPTA